MSRLTASPFHKPSPFEFPRALPVSPPETNSDAGGPPAPIHEPSASVAGGIEAFHSEGDFFHHHHSPYDSMGSRVRRGPSIPYHSSGLREAKERTVQRSTKSFIIVIPPPILLQEHGQLGHTLSQGPRHRLGQGMLMPLFPTMYGQLSAIAREFNFPSTAGICLYFHFSENGVASTPRISEDSWQMIWGWALSPESPQKPPICGKLEFDLDLRFARWYHAWLSSSQREHMDIPMSVVPSTAPSLAHFRSDSRHTEAELLPRDEEGDTSSLAPQSTARHIPRKLSLVDRLEPSHRSFSRPSSRSGLSPPEQVVQTQVLSPIFQEDEPKTAKHDLEKRVNTWRVSASLTATSLAIKQGQTSLEPANIPNDVTIGDVDEDSELNLEDFAWSVSSQGPPDYDETLSLSSWDRVPSVHLAQRNQGSVCLTPSTVTSFGPSDYTLPSPAPSSLRIFTPDIARRLFEDIPLTPSTVTTWGPPSEYPLSPYSDGGVSSVDLPYRLTFSRPTTPTTATSWGPSSWPSSPVESVASQVISVHLGDRGAFSRPVTPSTVTSWGAPLSYPPSPTTPFYVSTPDAGQRAFDEGAPNAHLPWIHGWPYHAGEENLTDATPWNHGWPYHVPSQNSPRVEGMAFRTMDTNDANGPWNHGWPYHVSQQTVGEDIEGGSNLGGPWSHGWPYHSQNPLVEGSSSKEVSRGAKDPWAHNWPYRTQPAILVSDPWEHGWPYTQSRAAYPERGHGGRNAGYPDFELYPPVMKTSGVSLQLGYPYFDLYPACYPYNLHAIYPPSISATVEVSLGYPDNLLHIYPAIRAAVVEAIKKLDNVVQVTLKPSYPFFDLYPATYPGNLENIYPIASAVKRHETRHRAVYPNFDLYPAIEPGVDVLSKSEECNTRLPDAYPVFRIYSAVYPWNLQEIYPPAALQVEVVENRQRYPFFNLYSAVYPHFDLYPSVLCNALEPVDHRDVNFSKEAKTETSSKSGIPNHVEVHYPIIVLYRPVYPFLTIYHDLPKDTRPSVEQHYPYFDLYPSRDDGRKRVASLGPPSGITLCQYEYPDILIYPSVTNSLDNKVLPEGTPSLSAHYPFFDLYPPTYPHFNLYPALSGQVHYQQTVPGLVVEYPVFNLYPATSDPTDSVISSVSYPFFTLYPAVYPHFDIYPSVSGCNAKVIEVNTRIRADYPAFELYSPVYPFFSLWPTVKPIMHGIPSARRQRPTHAQLHRQVFGVAQLVIKTGPSKTHRRLHEEVFPVTTAVSTPSGTYALSPVRQGAGVRDGEEAQNVVRPASRSSSIMGRPVSVALSPSRGLPSRPNSYRLSMAEAESPKSIIRSRISPGDPPSQPLPPVPQPLRRSVSSVASNSTSRVHASSRGNRLPAVDEREVIAPLARSSSLSDTSRKRFQDRSEPPTTESPVPTPRKRDSLVLQRVRAINADARAGASGEGEPSVLSLANKFPMPPRPPLPSRPA
ncbi:hypothetical protein PM082_005489 [Marasmius tenuissimus]|nr:hypothetical protein PM082_005489 [Marasmius tenuissimus]